jgi:hypothetical protein
MSKMTFRSPVVAKRFALPMLAAAAVVALAGNAAHAGSYPYKLGPATWYGVANNYDVLITISGQTFGSPCGQISGTMGNKGQPADSTIQGYYCPATGKLTFLRKSKSNNVTFQSYTGWMSQADGKHVPQMSGVFTEMVNPKALGDYGFSAYQGVVSVP